MDRRQAYRRIGSSRSAFDAAEVGEARDVEYGRPNPRDRERDLPYAIATSRAKRDPAADLSDALPRADAKNFAAITEPDGVAELLRAIDGYQGHPVTLAALRLSPLLFQRPGELRAMAWSEVDLKAAEWRIPPSRRKLRKAAKENPRTQPNIVPLASQAVAILRELQRLTGNGTLVFPGVRTRHRPMSENTVNSALRRLWLHHGANDRTWIPAHGVPAFERAWLEPGCH